MIEREHAGLSLTRQCRLLELSRSSLYYRPVGESAQTLALMRRIDELYLQYPFYGSRQMVRHLAREGVRVGRHRVRRLMRLLGLEAIYRKPRTSVANPEHRVYPYLLRGCWPGGCPTRWTPSSCLAALAEALEGYGIPEIFNTDQGSQFTSIAAAEGSKGSSVALSRGSAARGFRYLPAGRGATSSTRVGEFLD